MEQAKKSSLVSKEQNKLTRLKEATWDTDLINNSKNNRNVGNVLSRADKGIASSGLARLALFKKLAEAASLKDGEAMPSNLAKNNFTRGKFMGPSEVAPQSSCSSSQQNSTSVETLDAESQNDKEKSIQSSGEVDSSVTVVVENSLSTQPNPRRRPFEATTGANSERMPEMNRGMFALINALNRPDDRNKEIASKTDENSGEESSSPPRKARRRIVKKEQECSSEEVSQTAISQPTSQSAEGVYNIDSEMPEDNETITQDDGNVPESGKFKGRNKRSKFDRPNYQRINMRKKCFTRFGAASTNRKKRMLKFRKRANRASARREMAEAAEWGLDADAQDDAADITSQTNPNNGETSKTTQTQQIESSCSRQVAVTYDSFSIAPHLTPENNDDTFKERLFADLMLSREQQSAVEQLSCGNTVYHQLTPPPNYSGYEGWFHQSSAWSQMMAGVVELHRHQKMFESGCDDSSSNGTAVGLAVLCDPTCPLPLPALSKMVANRNKNAKNNTATPSYNKGGAAITGEMTADERQEVVMRARCSEISYVICRPEMLLSSDWFKRSGLPPIACFCLLFAERILPAPWLADALNVFTTGRNNFSNVRPETACLVARLFSIFNINTENEQPLPLLITSVYSVDNLGQALLGTPSLHTCDNIDQSSKQIAVYSVGNKLTACTKLLLCLIDKGCLFSTVVFICESLSSALRLEQLLRQDGNIAVYVDFGSGLSVTAKKNATSTKNGPTSIELNRIASQDDIVQTALQHNKSSAHSTANTCLNVILTSVDALPHIFLYKSCTTRKDTSEREKTLSVFVGLPPSSEHFSVVNRFTDNQCCVLVDSSQSVETNTALRSVFALSGNIYLLKQIADNLLGCQVSPKSASSTRDPSAQFWKAIDIAALAQKVDCHPCLITALLLQFYRSRVIVDIAGSRQDCCSVRLYGSDFDSASLFETNPLLVAARRVEGLDLSEDCRGGGKSTVRSNQRSLTFSLCELANEMSQHPDQIRRYLYQLRPTSNSQLGGKTYSQRSPLVITFASQWSLAFKVESINNDNYDTLVMSAINNIVQNEKTVRANKVALANAICQVATPLASTKKDEIGVKLSEINCRRFTIDSSGDNKAEVDSLLEEEKRGATNELDSAKQTIEDIVDSWSSTSELTGRRVTPWAIARDLHGITLPGTSAMNGRNGAGRADWLPTMRVASDDFTQKPHLRISFLQLVDMARQALMS